MSSWIKQKNLLNRRKYKHTRIQQIKKQNVINEQKALLGDIKSKQIQKQNRINEKKILLQDVKSKQIQKQNRINEKKILLQNVKSKQDKIKKLKLPNIDSKNNTLTEKDINKNNNVKIINIEHKSKNKNRNIYLTVNKKI